MRAGRVALVIALFCIAVGAAGAVAVLAGLAPVSARAGHWAVTDWLLHFAMRRAVEVRSLAVETPPPLGDPMRRAAGHFETGCATCHGSPARQRPEVVRHMTPVPPDLTPRIPTWDDAELFWIVRHGVKFTAMPAWPAPLRDDEVWAMAAFLRRMPELDAESYLRLATGEGPRPQDPVVAGCARCHGADGMGHPGEEIPALAGQSADYLYGALRAYAEGRRHSGIMQVAVDGLDDAALRRLADHYAGLAPAGLGRETPPDGAEIALRGAPAQGVPACIQCHGPKQGPRNPAYPHLVGQHADYLARQLRLFRNGERGGSPFAPIMRTIAGRLTDKQIEEAAASFANGGNEGGP